MNRAGGVIGAKTFGVIGWSNSGKTTLLIGLVAELVHRGWRVSTMKHGHHDFDVDKPGKDSYRHRQAGATEVLVSSARRWALMHELRGTPEERMEDLLTHMSPVDLVLTEGFKSHPHDKLEVHRPGLGQPLICLDDPTVVAVASDEALANVALPVLDVNDVVAIADFISRHCGLGPHAATEETDAETR